MSKLVRWARTALLALPLAMMGGQAARAAADLPYLYDQIKKPPYMHSLRAALAGHRVPGWIWVFLKGGRGVANPGLAVKAGDHPYELYNVCKAHDCANNVLFVLYAPDGAKAWGMLSVARRRPVLYGHPGSEQMQLLRSAKEHWATQTGK